MPILAWAMMLQTHGPNVQPGNSPAAGYCLIALLALVTGLVVTMFIRTSGRRSSNRRP